jgi:hypothetical protein
MSGRPVHLLVAATIAAAASLFASSAFAGCYSCGPSVIYQAQTYHAPVVTYSAPMVYGSAYEAPMAYPGRVPYAPGCGCAAQSPMYVVNQGPAYDAPVVGEADPIPAYHSYRRAYPYYAGGHLRWHHRGSYRGYRGYGPRFGYRDHGPRFGYRGYDHHYGAVMPGARYSMRHPMVGGMHRGGMNRVHGMHRPMMGGMHHPMMGHMHRGPQHAGGMRPGSVHPMPPKQKMP